MIMRRLGLAIGAVALVFTGLTAAPALAKPVGPVRPASWTGCARHWIENGNKAYVEGCQGPGFSEFRAFAYCKTDARVTGPWVSARRGSWSKTSICWTGVKQNSAGEYFYGYDDRW